jgi:hypothetical protein
LGPGTLSAEQPVYAAADSAILIPVMAAQRAKLVADDRLRKSTHWAEPIHRNSLLDAADLENSIIPFMIWMRTAGIGFDAARWQELSDTANRDLGDAEDAIHALLDAELGPQARIKGKRINPGSHAQVRVILERLGVPLTSTGVEILTAHE